MFPRTRIIDLDLADVDAVESLTGLGEYTAVRAIVRSAGRPVGFLDLPVIAGRCSPQSVRGALLDGPPAPAFQKALLTSTVSTGLAATQADRPWPTLTVTVCTRNRVENLAGCLEAIRALDYPCLDVLVVDNAPDDDDARRLVRDAYPGFRYVCEPRPGLDWARSRAVLEARGEIVAYTDDDVLVDPHWARAIARVFRDVPEVMAVTGLVVPDALETESHHLFEKYGGFSRGFERRWYRADPATTRAAPRFLGAGQFGTGANMAFRRRVFDQIGLFDPALDVGTVTNGGGDLEMFFRVLKAGHLLVYEPAALVRHRHRATYAGLKKQLAYNGSFYAFLAHTAHAYPEERREIWKFGLQWFWSHLIKRYLGSYTRPFRFPRDLIVAEIAACPSGPARYRRAVRDAAAIVVQYGPQETLPSPARNAERAEKSERRSRRAVGIRTVDVARPLPDLTDVIVYAQTRIYVLQDGLLQGHVDVPNEYGPIRALQLCDAIADKLGRGLLLRTEARRDLPGALLAAAPGPGHKQRTGFEPAVRQGYPTLPLHVSVSIVVATLDRPDDLRQCLHRLQAQKTERALEIVVVDNHPASGLTPPVLAEFPSVVSVQEERRGLAYARNAGIVASRGEIIITTDDDVLMPEDWVERLVAPLTRSDVMMVGGNVLPAELETQAQNLFEVYGGLGRGYEPKEAGLRTFTDLRSAVPTWQLGATANAAFRAEIFRHPEIGLMEEALGPGTPTGVGEDTYLFYKILKAGYTIVYEPTAYVWHRHRAGMPALRRQLRDYSSGHVAYHLMTWLRDGDPRPWRHFVFTMVKWQMKRLYRKATRRSSYPLGLTLTEISGNLAGAWRLWRSLRRAKRLGRTAPLSLPTPSVPEVSPVMPATTSSAEYAQ